MQSTIVTHRLRYLPNNLYLGRVISTRKYNRFPNTPYLLKANRSISYYSLKDPDDSSNDLDSNLSSNLNSDLNSKSKEK